LIHGLSLVVFVLKVGTPADPRGRFDWPISGCLT
jgi:hypothetical protein